ncbi:mitochondrial inner-membrane-bound regulator-domain-containing protein [Echria macrotheca]|uniref:Mitochondrial inner-membrane-bound regulator-domain-containing protein n=1 Tax=Echria macrotheca TaxID=438768 RepID=A0AAJ0BHM6_9PEZI|nr:mitochondrial inner-membrane-bound regulator-domain-containing protein [Echria macrotheca]
MLRRRVPGSFVCLRCRTQLGQPAVRLPFALRRAGSHSAANAQDKKTDDPDDSASRQEAPPSQPTQSKTPVAPAPTSEPTPSLIEALEAFDEAAKRDHVAQESRDINDLPLSRQAVSQEQKEGGDGNQALNIKYKTRGTGDDPVFQSRGKVLKAKNERLPIRILGASGEAIVLRSKGRVPKDRTPPAQSQEGDESGIPLTGRLDDETAGSKLSETFKNIDELRPTDSSVLSSQDFAGLGKRLVDGFTSRQLRSYLRKFQPVADHPTPPKEPSPDATPPWVLERRAWTRVGTEKMMEEKTDGATTKLPVLKEKLAARIMRDCWQLVDQGAPRVPGRLQAKLRETEFGLVLLGAQTWLRDITQDLLEAGGRLELLCEHNTVSIFAPQENAEKVFSSLVGVLSETKTASLDTGSISSSISISSTALEDVGRMTNTLVRASNSRKRIHVSWIDSPPTADGRESRSDVVYRFLLCAFHPRPRVASGFKVLGQGERYVMKHNCGPQLPWQERRRRWARWSTPIGVEKPAMNKPVIPCDVLPYSIEPKPEQPIMEPTPEAQDEAVTEHLSPDTTDGWSREVQTDTSALFGHVVHSDKSLGSLLRRTEVDPSLPRTFVPVAPPFVALGFPKVYGQPNGMSILLRFIPDPRQDSASARSAPPLELRLEIADDGTQQVVCLRAIASSFTSDVLLPSAPVDVRLLQDRYFDLAGENLESHAPAVAEFLRLADLHPLTGQISTPPGIKGLQLPSRILSVDTPNTDSTQEESVGVDYLFAAAEIHHAVVTAYNAFKLSYKTIEAGQRGGKSAQITLEPTIMEPVDDVGTHDGEAFMKTITKLSFAVVNKKSTFGWEVRRE